MIKKANPVPHSIRSSKQGLKPTTKKPVIHHYPQPMIPGNKKRTNSSYIQSSNKKKLEQVGYSHKKYNSNSSLTHNKHKIFEVQHVMPVGVRSTNNKNCLKVYSAITAVNNQQRKSMSKNKIRKHFMNNQSLGEIGYCKKLISEKPKAISSCQGKAKARVLPVVDSPMGKQDNIKTDLDENVLVNHNQLERDCHNEENNTLKQKSHLKSKYQGKNNQQNLNSNHKKEQEQGRLANINIQQIKTFNQLTSKQISQLQSRSQTIDLLKFTIKTKLQKDHLTESPHKINSLFTSESKPPHSQYIHQLLQLKQLETNFYVEKITTLQNELNKFRKESERQEKEGYVKWQDERKKVLGQKQRVEEENALLKRENQALRAIIMKKLKGNENKGKKNDSLHVEVSTINEYDY